LADQIVTDRPGLMRFASAVFERWRKIDQPRSLFRVRLAAQQHLGKPKVVAEYLQNIGAVLTVYHGWHTESLCGKIKKYCGRDRKNALKNANTRGEKNALIFALVVSALLSHARTLNIL
jgi:hypothetical protein